VRRRTRVLVGVAALLAVALVVATGVALWPRIQEQRIRSARRARLAEALRRTTVQGWAESLLAFADDPEAVRAILTDAWLSYDARVARQAIQIYATTPEPHDPRIGEFLRSCATDTKLTNTERFDAFYLLDELETPTFPPEPDHFAGGLPVNGRRADVLGELRKRGVTIDEPRNADDAGEGDLDRAIDDFYGGSFAEQWPYGALVRIAQAEDCILRVENGTWQLCRHLEYSWDRSLRALRAENFRAGITFRLVVKGDDPFLVPKFDESLTPIRVFRALAALNGWELHRSKDDPDTWEVAPRR
jgi:hypothetical protein